MEKSNNLNVREGTDGNHGAGSSGASCDGIPKVSNSSHLVSPTTTINMLRGLNNVDVAATFRFPLTTVGDLDVLLKDIEAGKHDELLYGMNNDKGMAFMDALGAICNSIQAENTNADVIPCKVSHVDDSIIIDTLVAENINVDEFTIVQSISIQDNPSSYIAAAGGPRPKPSITGWSKLDPSISNANFRSLFLKNLCEGVNVSIPRKVVKTVKIHDVPIQVFLEDGLSIIETQIEDVLKDSLTIGFPLIEDTRFTIEIVSIPNTIVNLNVPTPAVEMTNDGFQTVGKKKKKGKSKSTNGGETGGHSNQPAKAPITFTNEGKITMSNSYAALEDESNKDVENIYDESAKLIHSKIGCGYGGNVVLVGELVRELVVVELVVGELVRELVVGELVVGELVVGELGGELDGELVRELVREILGELVRELVGELVGELVVGPVAMEDW
ncbi:hypothetical protein Tco_0916878 [Tanacetum coccineum]